jgi:hypothetical protein
VTGSDKDPVDSGEVIELLVKDVDETSYVVPMLERGGGRTDVVDVVTGYSVEDTGGGGGGGGAYTDMEELETDIPLTTEPEVETPSTTELVT